MINTLVVGYSEDKSNPFKPISDLYVNPTLSENILETIASVRDGVYEATDIMLQRMDQMMSQPSAYWIDRKSKIWLPSNPLSRETQSTILYNEEVLDMLQNFYPDLTGDPREYEKMTNEDEKKPPSYYVEGILEDILSTENSHKSVSLVLYDLPNRDCKALASNGEMCCNTDAKCQAIGSFYCNVSCQNTATSCDEGIEDYKSSYIDQIAKYFLNQNSMK